MRFTFITSMSGSPWGGSEELWSRSAQRLAEEGHQVSASVHHWPTLSPKVAALKEPGIELHIRPPKILPSLPARVWQRLSHSPSHRQIEMEWLRKQKPDLVVISQGSNLDGMRWIKLCREAGLPFAPIVQCNHEAWWPRDEAAEEAVTAHRAARRIFFVSQHNRKLFEYQIGEELPQAEVVWNPWNMPDGEPPEWPGNDGVYKLACVGRLEPAAKGQDLLFKVLALPQWRERPVELNLYGQGPWEQNLKRLATLLQLKSVHFRGHVSDLKKVWAENHLLVLPSRYEGLPLSMIEAMYCARPAVVTDVGGNAELCVEGETGFIAAAPVAGLLGDALERAWNSRDRWASLGLAARARVEKLVPKDPIGVFCQRLKDCASKS